VTNSVWDTLQIYGGDGGVADRASQDHQIFNGQGQSDQNAFYHAIVSAGIAFNHGVPAAHFYGQMREFRTLFSFNESFSYPDAARDVFNNEVGIRIAQYAISHGLPEAALPDLARDALNRGLLIVDEFEDSRLDISSFPVIRDDEVYDGPSSEVASQLERDFGFPEGTLPTGDASGEGLPIDWPVLDPDTSLVPMPRPDEGLLHDKEFEKLLDNHMDAGGGKGSKKDLSDDAAFKKKIISPLVIDLDGDGVELISLEDSTAFFDLNLDGFAELTGWVSADDALLALDADGDGIIDNNSELFGNQTGHANGFLALAAHDGNADGVIDANDAVFADLIAWRDMNGDGFSAESEMVSLTDVGITSIDLAYVDVNETNAGAARQIRTNLS